MTSMTEAEWRSVQTALCAGGLRECIDNLLASRVVPLTPVFINSDNYHLMQQAWDDGNGTTVRLMPAEDAPWFVGVYDDFEVCEGLEHEGVLYLAVYQSGGGLVSVIVGEGIVENDAGTSFRNLGEAKAYIQGRIA